MDPFSLRGSRGRLFMVDHDFAGRLQRDLIRDRWLAWTFRFVGSASLISHGPGPFADSRSYDLVTSGLQMLRRVPMSRERKTRMTETAATARKRRDISNVPLPPSGKMPNHRSTKFMTPPVRMTEWSESQSNPHAIRGDTSPLIRIE
jgi:hypothetical protein